MTKSRLMIRPGVRLTMKGKDWIVTRTNGRGAWFTAATGRRLAGYLERETIARAFNAGLLTKAAKS